MDTKIVRLLRALVKITTKINELRPLSELLEEIVKISDSVLNVSYSSIILVDEKTMTWTHGATSDPLHKDNIHKYAREKGATYHIVKERMPLIVPDVKTSRFGDHPFLQESGIKSFAGFPIIHNNVVVGVLYVFSREKKTFPPQEKEILRFLSEQAAVAINNAKLYEKLKEKTIKDELTGLYNHLYLKTIIDRELERIKLGGKKSAFIYMDLDDFNDINKNFGAKMGDQVLKHVAHIIIENIRRVDVPAKYGGDEFMILLYDMSEYEARVHAERILNKIREEPFVIGNTRITLTASIGVTELARGKDYDDVLKEADLALFEAKRKGKNCVEVASSLLSGLEDY